MHQKDELGRKDDAESWLYMLADFMNPNGLPWRDNDNMKDVEMMKRKIRNSPKLMFTDKVGLTIDFVLFFILMMPSFFSFSFSNWSCARLWST